ncbi:transcriptional regulator, XRE family [Streptococcus dysgalactiae subsp. dysgalactiae]|uniref:Transcriptional regulator, XRE family n=1 Tax=Streptococcus dysgalactiae subsp. dysgalactiae TaxID=99822 RepID=A0A380K011_STRDY|nr:helix-turn-helix transcriptional regulator [Streptococcus dysgalactiae]SUN51198.1 transcriptional regulator, XRE family [Streptococcus dysgalactiae subsp. dysgalactiae]
MKNNFRVLLAKKRKKISDVHRGTNISKSTLTALYYERTKNPETETLIKIANYLDVTLDDLLTPEMF